MRQRSNSSRTYQVTKLPTYQLPPTVLFDGVCNLCSGSVQFVINRDPEGRFRFASLQSGAASRLLRDVRDRGALPDSIVLIEAGRIYTRSDAALRIARHLRFPWWLASGAI